MSKECVYILSPVRHVTDEQTEEINNHKKSLAELSDIVIFNPKEDAPQEDKTGFNIVMTELNFLYKIAREGGRVDILWNKGGKPSEGSRVDIGMAYALDLKLKLVKVFNEKQPTGPQVAFEIIKEIVDTKPTDSENIANVYINKIEEIKQEMIKTKEAIIDWDIEFISEEQEWQRIRLGLALGCMVRIPDFKIKLGKLTGEDPVNVKSYPKVIKEIENRQQSSQ